MKLFAVVVLVLACFPELLDCFSSARPALYLALDYATGTPAPNAALNAGGTGVDIPATARPDNRGFLDSTVSVSTAVPITLPHPVPSLAKAPFHLNLGQLQAFYSHVHQWLRIISVRFIGGVIAVFQYSLFLIIGLAFLRKQIVDGLPPQSELVVVPIPVRAASPVIECRVPDTRAPMPPTKPPRRPLVRRPLLNSSISRLVGPKNNAAPQAVAPVQPPRGAWIELMSLEGKLVLCSHHTGPGGSVEWTMHYFPRHEHSYYLSHYPASPSLNPLLKQLLGLRPFVLKVPGETVEEVFNYLLSTSRVEPEVDANSVPLPLSRPESPGGSTSRDVMQSSSPLTLVARPDSDAEAAAASSSSIAANANTNSVEPISLSLPYLSPAIHRRHSCPSLQTYFAHAPFQDGHASRRMSVAFEQMPRLYLSSPETSDEPTSIDMIESSDTLALTQTDSDWETVVGLTADADADANSVVVGSFPLPHPNPAARRRHSFPNLRTDAPSQRSRSSRRASVSGEQTARLYLSKPESPDHHTSVDGADSFNARPPIQVDLDSEAKVASTADANAKSAEASEVPLPRLKAATRRRHSCPDLRIYFSHAPSQQFHSSRRVSIAVEQMPRLYLTRPRHAPQHLVDNEIEREAKEEVKFKFRRGGKRNTARKHRRQMQDQDQGNPGAGPSSAN